LTYRDLSRRVPSAYPVDLFRRLYIYIYILKYFTIRVEQMIRRLTKINAFKEVSDLKESTRGIFWFRSLFLRCRLKTDCTEFLIGSK